MAGASSTRTWSRVAQPTTLTGGKQLADALTTRGVRTSIGGERWRPWQGRRVLNSSSTTDARTAFLDPRRVARSRVPGGKPWPRLRAPVPLLQSGGHRPVRAAREPGAGGTAAPTGGSDGNHGPPLRGRRHPRP